MQSEYCPRCECVHGNCELCYVLSLECDILSIHINETQTRDKLKAITRNRVFSFGKSIDLLLHEHASQTDDTSYSFRWSERPKWDSFLHTECIFTNFVKCLGNSEWFWNFWIKNRFSLSLFHHRNMLRLPLCVCLWVFCVSFPYNKQLIREKWRVVDGFLFARTRREYVCLFVRVVERWRVNEGDRSMFIQFTHLNAKQTNRKWNKIKYKTPNSSSASTSE